MRYISYLYLDSYTLVRRIFEAYDRDGGVR